MSLTAIELNEAGIILSDTSKTKTQRVRDYYAYLASKGENYGRLGLGVTNNDTWQGQVANGFAESGAQNNNKDMSYGSQGWGDLNLILAGRHQLAYVANNGGTPTREQIQGYHNDAYEEAGLDADDWFPNKGLNESSDPDALWDDWQTNSGIGDLWEDAAGVTGQLAGPIVIPGVTHNLPTPEDYASSVEFSRNFLNALDSLDAAGLRDLLQDFFGEAVGNALADHFEDNLGAAYGWAFKNPGAILNELSQWMQDVAGKFIEGVAELPPSPYSPLVLDLDGDGIELTDVTGPGAVYFDLDNDGLAERAGWVTGGDGLLALDRNDNGTIDAQNELFGDTATAANGFENLKTLDSNGDNKITLVDAQWNDLRVWVDANADGVSQAAELTTLSSFGISSINLAYSEVLYDLSGNQIRQESTFVQNGVTRPVVDAWFTYDRINSEYVGDYTLDVRTLFLPTLRGYGDVKDLHIAMSQDETLLDMVTVLATATVADVSDPTFDYKGKMQAMIERWAGVDALPTTGNVNFNFRNSAEMVKFMGLENGVGLYVPDFAFTDPLKLSLQMLTDSFTARFMAQTPAFAGQMFAYNPVSDQFEDGMGVMALIASSTGGTLSTGAVGSTNHVLMFGQDGNDNFFGGAWNDRLYGGAGNDQLSGSDGNDVLNGGSGNDGLFGGSGSDALSGGDDDDFIVGSQDIFATDDGIPDHDIIDGGRGADNLYGSWGDDTYVFRAGDSPSANPDYVNEIVNQGTDTIHLTGGILPSSVTFTKSPGNYWYSLNFGTDEIRLVNHTFTSSTSLSSTNTLAFEKLTFDNGTVLNLDSIINAPPPPPNAIPVAQDDNFTGDEDVPIPGNVLANNGNGVDSDPDGDPLSVVAVTGLATTQGGSVEIAGDGSFTYTPSSNFNGLDSFNYTLQDVQGGSDVGTVNLTVNAVDDAPVVTNNGGNVDEDNTLTLTQAMLSMADIDTPTTNRVFTLQSVPANGTLYLNAAALIVAATFTEQDIINGLVTYEPTVNFNESDSFDFTASDGTTALPGQSFNITVNSINDAPQAVDDTATTDQDAPVNITVLSNDSDIDGGILSVTAAQGAANGTLAVNLDNTVTYTPNTGFNGADSFSYTLQDGQGGSDTGTVNLTVNAVGTPPVLPSGPVWL